MKIVQITDIHINRVGELISDINTTQKFSDTLKKCLDEKPDVIILTGDLCHSEVSKDVYRWIKKEMDATGIPYHIIGGNHDNPGWIREIFYESDAGENFFTVVIDNYTIVLLNSADGTLGENQLNWLKINLEKGVDAVFMHHPPVTAGVPYMDSRYAFLEMRAFESIVKQYPANLPVFCGHYHTARTILRGNMQVFITPSCFLQIGYSSIEFAVDHYQPAYRVIEFFDGEIRTWVKYLI
ncbi:MAG: metallophosphoesterase [Saprospiraceae bacterium]|nr:metallophosphoesterase [Saprospiraceae bacterium]